MVDERAGACLDPSLREHQCRSLAPPQSDPIRSVRGRCREPSGIRSAADWTNRCGALQVRLGSPDLPGSEVISENLAAVARGQAAPGGQRDAVADEAHRAVADQQVDTARVLAAGAPPGER